MHYDKMHAIYSLCITSYCFKLLYFITNKKLENKILKDNNKIQNHAIYFINWKYK